VLAWLKFQTGLSLLRREQRRIDAKYVEAIRNAKAQCGNEEATASMSK
jgi:hypothetical protein